jgi:hypothetical protein
MSIFDSLYTAQEENARRRRDQQLAQYGFGLDPSGNLVESDEGERRRLRLQFGYDTSGDIDVKNPFGQATLLREAYQRGKKAITGQLGARGQFYAGYRQSKENQADNTYNINVHQMRGQFDSALGQLFQAALGAKTGYDDTVLQAYEGYLGRREAAPPAPAASPANAFPGVTPSRAAGLDPALAPHIKNDMAAVIARHGANNVKLTASGLFYRRLSDGKWIPVR